MVPHIQLLQGLPGDTLTLLPIVLHTSSEKEMGLDVSRCRVAYS